MGRIDDGPEWGAASPCFSLIMQTSLAYVQLYLNLHLPESQPQAPTIEPTIYSCRAILARLNTGYSTGSRTVPIGTLY